MRPFLLLLGPLVVTYAESLFLGQFLRTTLWPQEENMRPVLLLLGPSRSLSRIRRAYPSFILLMRHDANFASSLVDPAYKLCFLLSDGRENHCRTHLKGALPG